MPEVKTVKNVSTKTVAITVEETTGIAAKSASTASRMKTVRNESTGNAAITVAETIIVTAERMPTVKTVAGAEKNANTAESGNYDRKNYQGGNNERGEQKRGDNPQS